MENIFTHWESVINFTRNDIVFEHQNKQYGAYAIRKYYPERLRNAFFYSVAGMLLLFTIPLLLPQPDRIIKIDRTEPVYEPVPYPPQTEPSPSTPKRPKKSEGGTIVPVTNDIAAARDSAMERGTEDAEPSGTPNFPAGVSNNTSPNGIVENIPEPDPVVFAPVMPKFKGGEPMLDKFLKDNLKYPGIAREAGISGRLYVTFAIDRFGKVKNVAIRRGGLGGGLEEEALRVIRIMPDWEPGRNALGEPIAVQLTIPIKFVLR